MTAVEELTVEQRVDAGFRWLLEVRPSAIATEIDLDLLNMRSGCDCCVGQIITQEVERHPEAVEAFQAVYGFCLDSYDDIVVSDYEDLDWVREAVADVDDLDQIVMTNSVAAARGFHTITRADSEWDELTAEWDRRIRAYRAAL